MTGTETLTGSLIGPRTTNGRVRLLASVIVAALASGCGPQTPDSTGADEPSAGKAEQSSAPQARPEAAHVGSQECTTCHAQEAGAWAGSHHDLAMQPATDDTVLGDFDDAAFTHGGIDSRFFRRDGEFFVHTDGPDGELADFRIAYTYGVEPLQQYLIEFPDGRLQALGICWDTRPSPVGGQRWFHLYPDERIDHADELHWTAPSHNWNFMCAECHSTNVRKNYDAAGDRFETSWSEIDVSCESCHGPGSEHVTWAQAGGKASDAGNVQLVSLKGDDASWLMNADTGIARRSEPRSSNSEIETCARCHSRRSILSEDYRHGDPLMNTHRVALLTDELYHPDGQIDDEVYVYGSFIQSKMHAAGVSCSDCHDSHSLELRAPGNAVCAQCHLPAVFDTPEHYHHAADTDAAQCVNCHMPARNYMVVDPRRDHSFRVPRPDLTETIGTPNACADCHDEQSSAWAREYIAAWFPDGQWNTPHYGEALYAGRRGLGSAAARLISLAEDVQAPGIARATALSLLPRNPSGDAAGVIARAAESDDPLIRMAAANAAIMLEPGQRIAAASGLLDDPVLAVRLVAAGSFLGIPAQSLTPTLRGVVDAALEEYRQTQILHSDRAESRVNLGALHAARAESAAAAAEYQAALRLNPLFVPAYINLADLYRVAGREAEAQQVLMRGLDIVPDSPDLYHALGLSLVRQQRTEDALLALARAAELAPQGARFSYVYAVALNSVGRNDDALRLLENALEVHPTDRDILFALVTMNRDAGNRDRALVFARRLSTLSPGDVGLTRLIQELE